MVLFIDSKTRTYLRQVGAGRGGRTGRDEAGRDADGFAKTTVPLALQGIEDNCPEQLFRSTGERNVI